MLVIASVDDYGAPTRAIGCALIIFRSVSFFLAVLFHRAHINACFWKQSKQLGKLRLHLLDVVTAFTDDGLEDKNQISGWR